MQYYVLQKHNFGIGNFINCTPALQHVAEVMGHPVPVLFELPHVAEMYQDCPFIEPIESEGTRILLFGSNTINQSIPDWQYIQNKMHVRFGTGYPGYKHTYVDNCPKPKAITNQIGDKPYCVVVRGTVENQYSVPGYTEAKDPGDDIYRHMIHALKERIQIVFIGTDADYKRWLGRMGIWCYEQPGIFILNNIRDSLGALKHAKYAISNDTGMYHAAAALKLLTFVLWKKTNFEKNKAPGNSCMFSHVGNWETDFIEFLTTHG